MSNFLSKLDLTVRYHESIGEKHMAYFLRNQLDLLKNITERKKDYIVASYYVPGELLELLDVEVVYMERVAGIAAAWRIFKSPVLQASLKGFPTCACSYQALFDLLIDEVIPKPVGFVALSYTCNDAWTYCKMAAEKYDVPFYYIDVPQKWDSVRQQYLAMQLNKLYHQLVILFHEKTSIYDVITASNEAQKVKSEIESIRLKKPGNIIDFFKLFPLYNDLGKKSTVEILKSFKNKLENDTVEYSKDATRILWLGVLPLYRNSFISDIEKQYKFKVVCEEMFDFGGMKLSYNTFFDDLAQRIMCSKFFSVENRIEAILNSIKNFGIEGIIHFSQRNCKFLPPMITNIRKKVENIPFVEISGDVIDPNFFDEKKAWNQIACLYEQIHRRPNIVH